jgi:hypothetical protein
MFLITDVKLIFKHSIVYGVLVLDIRYSLSVFLLPSPNIRIISTDQTAYWELQFDESKYCYCNSSTNRALYNNIKFRFTLP